LSTAVSGPLAAAGINSFSQAKAAGVKVNADVPGDFTAAVKLTGRVKKALSIWNLAAIKCVKMKTAPAGLNGNTWCRHGSSAISASAGRRRA
jgi:endonuclease I